MNSMHRFYCRAMAAVACGLVVTGLLAGCGGGGSGATSSAIEGVATPSSVSVVTATNAD